MTAEAEQRIDYRTREGRAIRAQANEQGRGTQREGLRNGEFRGHGDEVLTRRRQAGIDQFHIPKELVPAGWAYQWNTVSVFNNQDLVVGQQMQMYENGWRPVPAERHPGRFVPVGKTGDIIRDGQRLEERPIGMTEQAREEDIAVARRQMRDRDESLMGGKAGLRNNVPGGFEMNPGKYRGTGGQLRMNIDPAIDVPSPKYEIAVGEE